MKTALAVMLLVIASVAAAETNPSLATVLTPDGPVTGGVSGSFDPSGLRKTNDPDGEPLFVKEGASPWEAVPLPEGLDSEGIWYSLGSGVNGWVYAIAVSGSDVYVGGRFTQAGGNPANHIARWDGSSWSTLGSGVDNTVRAIAVAGTDTYVGGSFTQAGDNPANHIARWDGNAWSAVENGVNNTVNAIAVRGSEVYAGGAFNQAGGSPANRIALWDGSSWSALGSGVTGYVYSVAVNDSYVYAGGVFTQAGELPASRIARWNGSYWSALGNGTNNSVEALGMLGSDVYVGGRFSQAGSIPANRIACWDGSPWSALGSGVNSTVRAISVSDSTVYVGGDFTQAGELPASYIACWVEQGTAIDPTEDEETPGILVTPNPITTGANLSFKSIGPSPLTLSVYDTAGRLVRKQELGILPAGSYSHYWDGRDGSGSPLVSGVYFIRISSTEQQASTRVVLIR